MNRFIHRHILLPAFETGLKRRRVLRYWRDLERSQWMAPGQIAELQLQALARLLDHAFEHCPYYRESWQSLGLRPGQLTSLEEFGRWPVIDREVIRQHRFTMRADIPSFRLISKATGGSSGVPLRFDLDLNSQDRRTAAWHRGYGWAGAEPGTRQLHLWGVPAGNQTFPARLKDRLYNALYRRRMISCMDDAGNLTSRFAGMVQRHRPEVIVAYTSPLYEVSRQIEEAGSAVSHHPRSILVGAEKLHPFQRETIERVFGAPVFETYGSREFMLIGAECDRHRGLHLSAENLLVEVLDDDGCPTPAGVEGNIVITDLFNYGMPFVRYSNGDRAVAGLDMCPCGRGLPVLQKVVGRRLDMLLATGGRLLPGEFFPHLVKDFAAVRRFQVVQEEPGRVRFALAASGMSPQDRSKLEGLVRGALGPEVRVDFEPVEQVPLTAAGKLQVVINRIPYRKAG